MLRVLKWVGVPVLAVALLSFDASRAQADNGFRIQIGGLGGHHHHGYRVPSYGYRSFRSGYGSYYGGGYVRPHFDYHPPSLVPHRGHYHYMPGHFDLHYGPHYGHPYGRHHGRHYAH